MIFDIKGPNDSTMKYLHLLDTFSKALGFEANIQKLVSYRRQIVSFIIRHLYSTNS